MTFHTLQNLCLARINGFPFQDKSIFHFKPEFLPLNKLKTKQNKTKQTLGTGITFSLTVLAFCGKAITQVIKYFVL